MMIRRSKSRAALALILTILACFTAGCRTSWSGTDNERKDLWVLGPLGKYSWGRNPGATYLAPVFYANPSTGLFASPIYSSWEYNERSYKCIPPLLSWLSVGRKDKEINGLFGLFFETWGKNSIRQGHLIPVYFHRGGTEFYTLLFGWKRASFAYMLTPLVGLHRGHYYGGWLLPLFSFRGDPESGDFGGTVLWGRFWKRGDARLASLVPVFYYKNHGPLDTPREQMPRRAQYGKTFWLFPAAWYRNLMTVEPDYAAFSRGERGRRIYRRIRENGIFPLWSYISHQTPEQNIEKVRGNLLWFLYRYRKDVEPIEGQPDKTTECVRSAILFKLWERERVDDTVTTRIFPGICYSHSKGGAKGFSILHSLFRYDNTRDRKITLLYLIHF